MKKFRLSLILLFLPIIIQANNLSKTLYGLPYGFETYQSSIHVEDAGRADYELYAEYSGYPPYNGWAYAEINNSTATATFSNSYDYNSGIILASTAKDYVFHLTVSDQGSATILVSW